MLPAILTAVFTSSPLANFAIWCIIGATIIGLMLLFFTQVLGWQPPPYFWRAIGMVAGAVFFIILIIFLVQFANSPTPMF